MMSHRIHIGMVAILCGRVVSAVSADNVDYVRDVRPILKTHCFRCHGPLKAESGLRLDTKPLMLKGGDSGPALTAGEPAASLLLKRIRSESESRMPPDGERLPGDAIDTLRRWIAAGAISPPDETPEDPRAHWSYRPIARPEPPRSASREWSANPIDAFVTRRRQGTNVRPNSVAQRHVLLRRVYLDLIGMPPTREELRAFLADESPEAFVKVVDRLLASPHYGERWGRHWLDVWRYSDWYGFQDQVRFSQKNIWHWRDWVVESLNADAGYDRMVMAMLAGDEITPFDPSHLRATGFLVRNRNTDSREQWIRDTVEHSAKAFLGITMGCVQCHDHPYDPISHDEYYRYRNFFEPVSVAIDSGGGGPGGIDLAGVARIFDQNRNAKTKFYIRGNDKTPDASRTITPGVPQVILGNWSEPKEVSLPPLARIPHLREAVHLQSVARLEHDVRQAEKAISAAKKFLAETRQRLAAPSQDSDQADNGTFLVDAFDRPHDFWRPGRGAWRFSDGHIAQSMTDTQRDCYLESTNNLPTNFTLRLRLRVTDESDGLVGVMFNRSPDGSRGEAVMLSANPERSGLRFFFEYGDERHFRDQYERQMPIGPGNDVVLRVDFLNGVVNVYVNDLLQQAYQVNAPAGSLRLLTIGTSAEFHHVRIEELSDDAAIVPPNSIPLLMPLPSLDRSHPSHLELANDVVEQSELRLSLAEAELNSYHATQAADTWRLLHVPSEDDEAAIAAHTKRQNALGIAAQAAQRKLQLARSQEARFKAAHELRMAEALQKPVDDAKKKLKSADQQVEAATMTLNAPPEPKYQGLSGNYGSSSGRRLALARWVADAQNPLTPRVAVNHIWLRHFGRPLVDTVFDFGINGSKPTHPELLDWLAAEFMQPSLVHRTDGSHSGWTNGDPQCDPWSMKHLHRLIVTSRTWRSASTRNTENLTQDPDNILLWRMPPVRMDAETVRDSVLTVAGTLDRTQGGPDLPTSDGLRVKRRSLYFHHSPADQMSFLKLFDAADPTESYQRHVSIVPHQALALFNSELALVQSRHLARRISPQFTSRSDFIHAAFEQLLSRQPTGDELQICTRFLTSRESRYQTTSSEAERSAPDDYSQPAADPRLHARENLIHALFNHHDFVTIP